jgi:hypothetical protein
VPGRLSQQYACGGVRVRRDPTTLRERRCHNCRPTKMTCSPVILGRVDTTNWPNFPLAGLEATIQEKFYPARTRRKPIPKYRSRPLSNGCALSSSGLITTSASRLLSCGRRGLNPTWLGSATPLNPLKRRRSQKMGKYTQNSKPAHNPGSMSPSSMGSTLPFR